MQTDRPIEEFVRDLRPNEERANLMTNCRRIVAFSPHPDDTEIIAGGFLAAAVRRGAEVKVVVAADDRMAFTSPEKEMPMEERVAIRKREEKEALKVLGIKDVEFLEYIDSELPEARVLFRDFVAIMRDYGPDLAITVDPLLPHESQSDHINTGRAVMEAVLLYPLVHAGGYLARRIKVKAKPPIIALGWTSSPNAIVRIDETIDTKVAAILSHASQFPDGKKMDKAIRRIASVYGQAIKCNYAEAFKVLRLDELHMDVGLGGFVLE